jgi:putative ABC transport system permease protein
MPPRFGFPENQRLWIPLAPIAEKRERDTRDLQVFARMRPGTTLQQASTDVAAIGSRLAAAHLLLARASVRHRDPAER